MHDIIRKYIDKLEFVTSIKIEKINPEEVLKGSIHLNQSQIELSFTINPTDVTIEEYGTILIFVSPSMTQQVIQKTLTKAKSLVDEENIFIYSQTERIIDDFKKENIFPPTCQILDILSLLDVVKNKNLSLDIALEFYQLIEEVNEQEEEHQKHQSQHYQFSQEKEYYQNDYQEEMNEQKEEKEDDENKSNNEEDDDKDYITYKNLLFGDESSGEEEEVHYSGEEEIEKEKKKNEQQKEKRKRTGQMVFGADGNLYSAPAKKKRATKKKTTKK